jgi:hypothetical protein
MSQHAKKTAHHATAKKSPPSLNPQDTLEKAEQKVLSMSRGNMKKMMHTAEDMQHTAVKCVDICSGNLGACMESAGKSPKIIKNISSEIFEGCNQYLAESSKIYKEAAQCHTAKDVIDLPGKVMVGMLNNYFDHMAKLSAVLFDSTHDALEPLRDRTGEAYNEMRRLLAV